MVEEINLVLDRIQPVLNELATKLGVTSEYLWRILIKQQYVEGGIALFFFLIISIGIGQWVIRFGIKNWENDGVPDNTSALWMMGMVVFIISIVICIPIVIQNFVNPEYQALKNIFELILPK